MPDGRNATGLREPRIQALSGLANPRVSQIRRIRDHPCEFATFDVNRSLWRMAMPLPVDFVDFSSQWRTSSSHIRGGSYDPTVAHDSVQWLGPYPQSWGPLWIVEPNPVADLIRKRSAFSVHRAC
jgi:hypothetical protein